MYMFELWRLYAFASIAMSLAGHIFSGKISHLFSILSSVEWASILCTGSIGCYKKVLFFSEKIAKVTHLHSNLLTWVVPKILLDRSCGYSGAVRIDLEDYVGRLFQACT